MQYEGNIIARLQPFRDGKGSALVALEPGAHRPQSAKHLIGIVSGSAKVD
jgi:hypothetical protein